VNKKMMLSVLTLLGLLTVAWVGAAERPVEDGAREGAEVGGELTGEDVRGAIIRMVGERDKDLGEALTHYRRALSFLQRPHCLDENVTRILTWIFSDNFTMPSNDSLPEGARYVDSDGDSNPEFILIQKRINRTVDSNGNGIPEAGQRVYLKLALYDRNDNGTPERVEILFGVRAFRDPDEDGNPSFVRFYLIRGLLLDRDENHKPDLIRISKRAGVYYDRNSDGNPEKRTQGVCRWFWYDRNLDGTVDVIRYSAMRITVWDRNSDGRPEIVRQRGVAVSYVDRDGDGNPNVLVIRHAEGERRLKSVSANPGGAAPTVIYTTRSSGRNFEFRDRNSNGWPDLIRVKKFYRRTWAWGGSVRRMETGRVFYSFTLLRGGNVEYRKGSYHLALQDRNADRTPEEFRRNSMRLKMIYNPRAATSGGGGDEEQSTDEAGDEVALPGNPSRRPTLIYLNASGRFVRITDRNSDGNPEVRIVRSFHILYTDRNLDGNPEVIKATFTRLVYYDRNSDGRIDTVKGVRCVYVYIDRDSDGTPEVQRSSCDRWERNTGGGRVGGGGTPGNGRPGSGGGGKRPSRPGSGDGRDGGYGGASGSGKRTGGGGGRDRSSSGGR